MILCLIKEKYFKLILKLVDLFWLICKYILEKDFNINILLFISITNSIMNNVKSFEYKHLI